MSRHRRATAPRLTAFRAGLAFATATALAGSALGGLTLTSQSEAAAVAAPVVAPAAQAPAPAQPVAARVEAPVTSAPAPTSRSKQTSAAKTTTAKPKTTAKAKPKKRENSFCTANPDRCTDGVPDKKSDRAEYQDDPRSNAEINSDMPLSAPEGLCPQGYPRIAGTC